MIDYSMNLEERKKFILGYKIKKGFMKVTYASGFEDKIQHNDDNENIVLDKMKKQVLDADEKNFIKKEKHTIIKYLLLYVCHFFSFVFLPNFIINLLLPIVLILNVIGMCSSLFLVCISLLKLYDFKKNKRFVEIEEELNKKVRKNENMLANVSSKTKNMVKSTPKDKPVFNINSFNYVPNRDLEQIMENINRDEYFMYKYEEAKPKIRRRIKED